MKFYIGNSELKGEALDEWAEKEAPYFSQIWIREIGKTIREWYSDADHILIKTSGSTGSPKVIRLKKNQMSQSAIKTAERFGLKKGMISLNCLPSEYIAGKMMIIRALVIGLDQICIQPKVSLSIPIDRMIDFAAMTPMQAFVTSKDSPLSLNKIHSLILGGGPITNEISDLLQSLKTNCFATYGMTETITHVAVAPANGPGKSKVFEGIQGVSFSTIDDCLVIEADHLDGLIETTDKVELIDSTRFRWLGRKDNVINSGGVKIQAEELERRLDWLSDRFFIAGIPDQISGEQVVLVIEAQPFNSDQMDFLQSKINEFKPIERPKRIVFAERLKETPTGKILRKAELYLKV